MTAYDQLSIDSSFTSEATERALLYCCLNFRSSCERILEAVSDSDFDNPGNAAVYRAIRNVHAAGKSVELITVSEEIDRVNPSLTADLMSCIRELAFESSTESYIDIVKGLAERRKTIAGMQKLLLRLRDPQEDFGTVMDDIRRDTADVATVSGSEVMSIEEVLINTYEYIDKRFRGEIRTYPSGLQALDNLTGGFFQGELTVIGARPAVGKSALGMFIAMAAAKEKSDVLIVSREMSDIQFGMRLISTSAEFDSMSLRQGEIGADEFGPLCEQLSYLNNYPLQFSFRTPTVEGIRRQAMRIQREGRLGMIIVDYLQLMATDDKAENETTRIGYISKQLKRMTLELNVPIIALAQLNRNTSGIPNLKDIRSSGDIEQDADNVIFIHKPNLEEVSSSNNYAAHTCYFTDTRFRDIVYQWLVVAKQRQGRLGIAPVLFDPAHMHYRDVR